MSFAFGELYCSRSPSLPSGSWNSLEPPMKMSDFGLAFSVVMRVWSSPAAASGRTFTVTPGYTFLNAAQKSLFVDSLSAEYTFSAPVTALAVAAAEAAAEAAADGAAGRAVQHGDRAALPVRVGRHDQLQGQTACAFGQGVVEASDRAGGLATRHHRDRVGRVARVLQHARLDRAHVVDGLCLVAAEAEV